MIFKNDLAGHRAPCRVPETLKSQLGSFPLKVPVLKGVTFGGLSWLILLVAGNVAVRGE